MIIENAKVFVENGSFTEKKIYIEDGLFKDTAGGDVLDATGLYAVPGLTDIHFHGCVGYDFCDGTHEAFSAMAKYELSNGITTMVPATMTYDEETLTKICQAAASYEGREGALLKGINMEGPFISPNKVGAQNPTYVQSPNVEMFRRLQAASNHMVKLVDIAPEEPGAMEFIRQLKDDVGISIAHTTADYDTALEAYNGGARQATHLYNAMPAFSHRAPGVIGAACDSPHCRVELITDGIHIHPGTVRATFKMFTDERIILISDSMMATGLTDGDYSLGGQPVKVVGNRATLADGTIAGSATNLMDCVRTAVKKMDIPLESAIKCAAVNPAKAVDIYDHYGSITPGKVANLLLLDQNLNLVKVFLNGAEQ